MTELTRALVARFSGYGMPVYLTGWVPADARPPYLTLTVEPGDWRRLGYLALTVWMNQAEEGNRRRLEAMERLAASVPEGGLRVCCPGEICVVRRARADFLRLVADPARSGALGGQVRFEMVRYPRGGAV